MTEAQLDLARRAVACKGWRWMPGMLDTTGGRFICYADCGEAAWVRRADDGCEWLPVDERLPDLTDPATVGCLLALVREAWGNDDLGTMRWDARSRWCAETTDFPYRAFYGDTEAEALVVAWEAAP